MMYRFSLSTVLLVFITSAGIAEVKMPSFRPQEIDGRVEIGYGLAMADVDGDGRLDILLADKRQIVWYSNPDWTRHLIAENLTALDNVCIAASDIDGDGKAEVAVGAGWNPNDTVKSGAVFYLQPPVNRRERWTPIELPKEPTVHRMRWMKSTSGASQLVVLPLHGRGNQGGNGEGVRMLAYSVPKDVRQPWPTEVVNASLHMTHNFELVDWNSKRGDELLVAGKEGVFLLDPHNGSWIRKALGGNSQGQVDFIGAGEVRSGVVMNGRRFLATVEPMHGNQACIYLEPPSNNTTSLWERVVIDKDLVDGHAVACGDLAAQGQSQVVVGWRGRKQGDSIGLKLYWSEDASGRAWKSVAIDSGKMACEDVALADLNGDGKLDIIASGRSTKNVMIYWNEGAR